MKAMTLGEIANAVHGRLNDEGCAGIGVTGVETDSRLCGAGSLFVPLMGERFDGHEFIADAFARGAACAMCERETEGDSPLILVDDAKAALGHLAGYYRSLFNVKTVAITGSSGKTTTKDIIASVLSQRFNVLKNQGNFNNEIGLPLTVFRMDEHTEVAVFEMGMSGFGEIERLSAIVRPDYAVITNIGDAHVENLGSREGILKAKSEIFVHMGAEGTALLNGDDDMLQTLKDTMGRCCYFGTDGECDFHPSQVVYDGLAGVSFTMHGLGDSYRVRIPQPGYHMVLNALVAAALGEMLGLTPGGISRGIELFKPSAMRMNIAETGGVTVIDDVYNSNPASVKAALDVLKLATGRKVCVLGNMLELGAFSPVLHYEVGLYAAESDIDLIICIGGESRKTFEGASKVIGTGKSDGSAPYFEDKNAFAGQVGRLIEPGDTVLVKASRGMSFEDITKAITECE